MGDENKFQPVTVHDTRSFLQSGVATRARLSIWTEGQKYSFTSRVQTVTDQGQLLYVNVPKDEEGGAFEEAVIKAGISECMFGLHLPTDLVYFKGEMRRSDATSINFKVVMPIYKLQRRTSLRLPAPSGETIDVQFALGTDPTQIYRAKLLNISDGGVGVMFDDVKLHSAGKEGTIVHDIRFTIGGFPVLAIGVVRHAFALPGVKVKDKYRWGIQFTQIEAKLKERLSRYTMEASAKFFGRI